MTDKEAFYEFARGFTVGLGIVGVAILFIAITTPNDPQPAAEPIPSKGTFRVIDHYKDCDLVQYRNGMLADYKYCLDCPK